MQRECRFQEPHSTLRKFLPVVGQPLCEEVVHALNAEARVGLGLLWKEVQMSLFSREVE